MVGKEALCLRDRRIAITGLFDQFYLPDHGAGRRQPLEPSRAREIIGAGQDRRRRWHQPSLEANATALFQPAHVLFERYVHPHLYRSACLCVPCRKGQANAFFGRLLFALENAGIETDYGRTFDCSRADKFRLAPHSRHAKGESDGKDSNGEP